MEGCNPIHAIVVGQDEHLADGLLWHTLRWTRKDMVSRPQRGGGVAGRGEDRGWAGNEGRERQARIFRGGKNVPALPNRGAATQGIHMGYAVRT